MSLEAAPGTAIQTTTHLGEIRARRLARPVGVAWVKVCRRYGSGGRAIPWLKA